MGRDKKNERGGKRFVRYDEQFMTAPTWKALPGNSVKLHLELIRRAFSASDGLASLSEREAVEALGIKSRDTVRRAYSALEKGGFIALVVPHELGLNGYGRAARWRLTHLPHNGKAPTREFAKNAKTLSTIEAIHLPRKQAIRGEDTNECMVKKKCHTVAKSLHKNQSNSKTLPWATGIKVGELSATFIPRWPRKTFVCQPATGTFLPSKRTFTTGVKQPEALAPSSQQEIT